MSGVIDHIEIIDKKIEQIKKDDQLLQSLKLFFSNQSYKEDLRFILDRLFNLNHSNINSVNKKIHRLTNVVNTFIQKFPNDEDLKIDGNCFKNDLELIYHVGLCIENHTELDFNYYNRLSSINKIKSFKFLGDDWDSYGARKIETKAIKGAIDFLNTYQKYDEYLRYVYPSIDGIVGLEYENKDKRIGFKIHNSEDIEFYNFSNEPITVKSPKSFFKNID